LDGDGVLEGHLNEVLAVLRYKYFIPNDSVAALQNPVFNPEGRFVTSETLFHFRNTFLLPYKTMFHFQKTVL